MNKKILKYFILFIICILNLTQNVSCDTKPAFSVSSLFSSFSSSSTSNSSIINNCEKLSDFTAKFLTKYSETTIYEEQASIFITEEEVHRAIDAYLKKFENHGFFKRCVDAKFIKDDQEIFFQFPYVQKVNVNDGDTVCFMGDIHGSMHSLLRNLWRLVALGHLNDNFKVANKKFQMIFTGDYTDRGAHSIEVLYILMRLKIANWDNVHLIRGNHERTGMNIRDGLVDEIESKYGEAHDPMFDKIINFYEHLPLAIYVVKDDDAIMVAHAGFDDYEYYHGQLLQQLLHDKDKKYMHIKLGTKDKKSPGFCWLDIVQKSDTEIKGIQYIKKRQRTCDVDYVLEFLKKSNLKALIRGHQHNSYGCKMLFKPEVYQTLEDKITDRDEKGEMYHWVRVIYHENPNALREHYAKGLLLSQFVPVLTFTTATGMKSNRHDCLGLLHITGKFKNWRFKIVETEAPTTYQSDEYLKQNPSDTQLLDTTFFTTIKKINKEFITELTSGEIDPIHIYISFNNPETTEEQQKEYLLEILRESSKS